MTPPMDSDQRDMRRWTLSSMGLGRSQHIEANGPIPGEPVDVVPVTERDRLVETLRDLWDFTGRDQYYAAPELRERVEAALGEQGRGE